MSTSPNRADLDAHICSLEMSLLDPAVRRSPVLVANLLADDFIEFGSSGRSFTKSQIIAALQEAPPVTITATGFRVTQLADTALLLTYRARRDGDPPGYSLRSSIWQLRGDKWRLVFHQGTPTTETPNWESTSQPE